MKQNLLILSLLLININLYTSDDPCHPKNVAQAAPNFWAFANFCYPLQKLVTLENIRRTELMFYQERMRNYYYDHFINKKDFTDSDTDSDNLTKSDEK